MRSLSADAAIVAMPSLLAAGVAVWAGEASFAAAAGQQAALPPGLLLPTILLGAFAATWAVYYLFAGLLAYRALSTSNGLVLFLVLSTLLLVLLLLNLPDRVPPVLIACVGAAGALRLVRLRPRRLRRPN